MGWQKQDHQKGYKYRPIRDGTYINRVRIGPAKDPNVFITENDFSIKMENPSLKVDSDVVGILQEGDIAEPEDPTLSVRMALRVPNLNVDSNGVETE